MNFAGRRGDLTDNRQRADFLIDKDFDEQEQPFGQHVSDAFALADVVVSTSGGRLKKDVERFIKLLFGDWTNTPTRDEVAMYHAQAAAFQSSSMARQVGAAL
jgi:deoxycytidylate deaminase